MKYSMGGDYEISDGREFSQLGFFIKTKLYKLRNETVKRVIINERRKREINNLHRRCCRTTKVVKKWYFVPEPPFYIL